MRTRFYDQIIKTQSWPGEGEKTDVSAYRKQLLTYFFLLDSERPDVVVVDSTPEIALFSKLLGFKVIYVYETLVTDELRFRLAWQNSEAIIFPYPKYIAKYMKFPYPDKLKICGGYTRFDDEKSEKTVNKYDVLISFGKGLNSESTITKLFNSIKTLNLKIAILQGSIDPVFLEKFNTKVIKASSDEEISEILKSSKIIICGAGYNTLMEAFYFGKKVICIPLEKVYDEQKVKAKLFAKKGALELVEINQIEKVRKAIINIEKKPMTKMLKAQREIIDGSGSSRAAKCIEEVINNKGTMEEV